ncbi:MAG: peroxiredoxin [Candidatus Nanohaloarchaeota archaeon QJJ-9]|nr:peroxiredoxin [Candidatus Nanohaloarchaeota archaeon QJJ-9]
MIDIDEKAPEFKAKAYKPDKGKIEELSLKELKGQWVIITFHPGDFTFVCATDLAEFADRYEDFKEENAEILAVSTDTVFSHKMWHETSERVGKVDYPMVEDIDKDISTSYGFLDESGMAKRGIAIIDPEGVVKYISKFESRLGKDVDHIYDAFKGLKHLYNNPGNDTDFDIVPACWSAGDETMHINVPDDVGRL